MKTESKMHSIINRIAAGALAVLVAAGAYLFVPPPRHAQAFEVQSTWGGTGGGTANAQTVAIANVQSLSDLIGVPLRYIPAADNTAAATIAVNGLTATAVKRPSNIGLVALSGGELQAGVSMEIMYDGAVIEIRGPLDMTPIGKSVEFRGSATPRGTLIEDGSCVSRTSYAALFSVIGTNYNACDGTTTFGVPDSRGTSFVALDGQGANGLASRITTASCATPNAVGLCGHETANLSIANINPFTPTGTVASSIASFFAGGGSSGAVGSGATGFTTQSPTVTSTFTGNSLGSGTAHAILNPVSLGRRAIKF